MQHRMKFALHRLIYPKVRANALDPILDGPQRFGDRRIHGRHAHPLVQTWRPVEGEHLPRDGEWPFQPRLQWCLVRVLVRA